MKYRILKITNQDANEREFCEYFVQRYNTINSTWRTFKRTDSIIKAKSYLYQIRIGNRSINGIYLPQEDIICEEEF